MSVDTSPSPRTAGQPRPVRPGWWFAPVPLARIAVLRVIVYCFVPVDVALTQSWVRGHARSGEDLYQPLLLARLLHMPTPTSASVTALAVVLVIAAVLAATGRAPRLTGTAVAVLYLLWMLVAMSYGKVDHDRVAYLVTLAVLPTVGPAGRRDRRPDQRAGWAVRCIQTAVMLTYFYAAWAKIRFGGWGWPTGATLERALLRRATPLSHWLVDQPHLLVPLQFAMIGFELLSPLILLARSDRARSGVAVALWGFHLGVFAGVTIIFLPHCVAIAALVPLERLVPAGRRTPTTMGPGWVGRGRRAPTRVPGPPSSAATDPSPH